MQNQEPIDAPLARRESSALESVTPHEPGPMELIAQGIQKGITPDSLTILYKLKQTVDADLAREAFARDMADFQTRCPIVAKLDIAYDKKYARMDRIHRETRELRKECGFFFTWLSCEIKDGQAYMDGKVGHRAGHVEPLHYIIPVPPELKGQNITQRAGSAMSYCKRYAECLALDIVTGDDDDGAGGSGDCIDEKQVQRLLDMCASAGRKESSVAGIYGKKTFNELPKDLFQPAMDCLQRIIDQKAVANG